MNTMKNGGLAKLVAFFLIVIVLLCTVGFAGGQWQSFLDFGPDSGDADKDNSNENSDADENKDGELPNDNEGNDQGDLPVVNPIPEYTDYLTGLEITQEESFIKYSCFVHNTDAPLYGISGNAITVEIPIEDGKSRFLVFKKDTSDIGKIGSIAPTRDYISYVASFFDSNVFSYGNDGTYKYDIPGFKIDLLDLKNNFGFYYTEYSNYVYTNGNLINALLKNSGANVIKSTATTLPFDFVNFYEELKLSTSTASNVIITYSESNTTGLLYSNASNKYLLSKNGDMRTDLLSDKPLEYDNVFILFADSTTYETKDSTEMILNTFDKGTGYFITEGTVTSITWAINAMGDLEFTTETGEKVIANRGSTYIGYVKSSQEDSVRII